MKIVERHEKIYFSHGLWNEITDGIFSLPNNELTIINDRFLPKIMKYLRVLHDFNDQHTIKLTWYEEQKPKVINR